MLLVASLSACASSHRHSHGDPNLGPTSMIYSPNGEPLNGGPLGRPTCNKAIQHGSRASIPIMPAAQPRRFMADATAQFARMDIDHNGYLVPEELERYRLPYRQDVSPAAGTAQTSERTIAEVIITDDTAPRQRQPIQCFSASHLEPDPVMAADVHNNFKVTLEDFLAQADRNFAELDTDHDGLITLKALLKRCERK